jgi:CubicO group peptidase (beta-lactamase class C family)
MRALRLLFLVLMPMAASADAVDDIVASEMRRQHIPGLAITVVKDGRIVKEAGYGLANLEHAVPVTPDTVFQSGSVGKQFTAALVMLLAGDHKLALDAPVGSYLSGTPDSWKGITMRHLLTHTSGLREDDPSVDLKRDYTEEELLQSALRITPDSGPGEKWRYSNLGYQLLGFICSRVGGRFYGDQLRERIFEPLGMHARIISERDLVMHRAAGYVRIEGRFFNQDWVAPSLNTTADGSLYLTVRDLAKWSLALDSDSLLDESLKLAMWTPAKLNDGSVAPYGFGWELGELRGRRILYHSGQWQGFSSFIARYPDDNLVVIALANRARASLQTIANRVAGHYVEALAEPPKRPPTAKVLKSNPLFISGTVNDDRYRAPLRRIAAGLYESQADLGPGVMAFKVTDVDESIALGTAFDEQWLRLGELRSIETEGEYALLELKHRTTYVFRLDARDPHALSIIVREVTR